MRPNVDKVDNRHITRLIAERVLNLRSGEVILLLRARFSLFLIRSGVILIRRRTTGVRLRLAVLILTHLLRGFAIVLNLRLIHQRRGGQHLLTDLLGTPPIVELNGKERFVVFQFQRIDRAILFFAADVGHNFDRDLILRKHSPRFGDQYVVLTAESHRADISFRAQSLFLGVKGIFVHRARTQNAAAGGPRLSEPADGIGRLLNGEVNFGVTGPKDFDHHVAHQLFGQFLFKRRGLFLAPFGPHFIENFTGKIITGVPDIFDQVPLPRAGSDPQDDPFLSLFVAKRLRKRQSADIGFRTNRIGLGNLPVKIERPSVRTDRLKVSRHAEQSDRIIREFQRRKDHLLNLFGRCPFLDQNQRQRLVHPAGGQIVADRAFDRRFRVVVFRIDRKLMNLGHERESKIVQLFFILFRRLRVFGLNLLVRSLQNRSRFFRRRRGKISVPFGVQIRFDRGEGPGGRLHFGGGRALGRSRCFVRTLVRRRRNVPAATPTAAHTAAHTTAAHTAHAAAHAAAHAHPHAAPHTGAHARLNGQVGDRVITEMVYLTPEFIPRLQTVNHIFRRNEEILLADAELHVVVPQNKVQGGPERHSEERILNDAVGKTVDLRTLFNRFLVDHNVDVQLILHLIEPVLNRKLLFIFDLDIDDFIERFDNLLFGIGLGKERGVRIFFLARFRKRQPRFGVRIEDRRFVRHRNVRTLDRHQHIEEPEPPVFAQILVLVPRVRQPGHVRRLNRKRNIVNQINRRARHVCRQRVLTLMDQRMEPLHDLFDLLLVLRSLIHHRGNLIKDRLVAHSGQTALFVLKTLPIQHSVIRPERIEQFRPITVRKIDVVLDIIDRQLHVLKRPFRVLVDYLAGVLNRYFHIRFDSGTLQPLVGVRGVHKRRFRLHAAVNKLFLRLFKRRFLLRRLRKQVFHLLIFRHGTPSRRRNQLRLTRLIGVERLLRQIDCLLRSVLHCRFIFQQINTAGQRKRQPLVARRLLNQLIKILIVLVRFLRLGR